MHHELCGIVGSYVIAKALCHFAVVEEHRRAGIVARQQAAQLIANVLNREAVITLRCPWDWS